MKSNRPHSLVSKCATGISGLDEITFGGVPENRTTLVLGGPGCGKTLLGLDFLRHGCRAGTPGLMVTVEQRREELVADAGSVGIDLENLDQRNLLHILSFDLYTTEFAETGGFTLDGLLVHIEKAVRKIGAKRIVLDQLDGFFSCFEDQRVLRLEFLRIAHRFTELGLTAMMLGSPPGGGHRMEEFLSDCVIHLDHRVTNQVSTRRLRVMKYRGTAHGTDEYPFSISSNGLRVFPITSSKLDYEVSNETIASGDSGLDAVLGGGYYRGSAVLIAGQAGNGKTTLACQMAHAAWRQNLRCVYFSFEESPKQLLRNAGMAGIDLSEATASGRFTFCADRPAIHGLEQHLGVLEDIVISEKADLVVLDPITNLITVGSDIQVKAMLTRLIDSLRRRNVTVLLTSLIIAGDMSFGADIGISSLMDVILHLENRMSETRRRRRLSVVKARGKANSQELCEVEISTRGIRVRPLSARDSAAGGPP